MAVDASELLLPVRGRGAANATEIKPSYVGGECAVDDLASAPCPHPDVLPCCAPFCVPPTTATETAATFFAGAAVPSTMSRKRTRGEPLGAAPAHAKRRVLEHAQAQLEKMNNAAAQQRRRHAAHVLAAAKATAAEWLRAKDEELERARWLAWALQERLRAACAEARAWRGAALAGEAAAVALRADLGHALRSQEQARAASASARATDADADVLVEDAGSCCYGDNDGGGGGGVEHGAASPWGACRGCGERAAAVLFLPCRHLSACAPCATAALACPACGSRKVGSVAVNLI